MRLTVSPVRLDKALGMASKSRTVSHLSDGSGFIQVKRCYLEDWIAVLDESPVALKLWLWLFKHVNRRNEVHVRQGSILAGAGISRAALFRAYKALEARNFIERDGKVIYLNSKMVWRGALGAAQSAEFCAEVKRPQRDVCSEVA